MPYRFLKTKAGVFKVVINDDIYTDINTREQHIGGKLISIGGKNTCVFIKTSTNSTIAHLANVKTRDHGCEINDKIISGANTIIMVKLAFTIVKETAPHVKTIELEDNSAFTCYLDDGRSFGISLALYELAFHQTTWYERYFDAKLLSLAENEAYILAKAGFDLPKQKDFDFQNKNLNQLLLPIYTKTNTWKEFFAEIYKIDKKCRIMFPWYKRAVKNAMGGLMCEGQIRYIDIYASPNESIDYKEVKLYSRGGTRKAFVKLMTYGDPVDYILERFKYIENQDIDNVQFTRDDLKIKRVS
jgi:hypothetical protein